MFHDKLRRVYSLVHINSQEKKINKQYEIDGIFRSDQT